jgi:uncharacterized membrane protein YcjF (UPF0283 family)
LLFPKGPLAKSRAIEREVAMIQARLFRLYALWAVLVAAVLSTGCELVGDIFQAGMWVGIVMVAVVVGLILLVVAKVRH